MIEQKIKRVAVTLSLFLLGLGYDQPAHACETNSYVGSICYTFAQDCPDKYLWADGSPFYVGQYLELQAVMGVRYGGSVEDGILYLPDLRGRSAIGTLNAPWENPPPRMLAGPSKPLARLSKDDKLAHNHEYKLTMKAVGDQDYIEVSTEDATKIYPDNGDYIAVQSGTPFLDKHVVDAHRSFLNNFLGTNLNTGKVKVKTKIKPVGSDTPEPFNIRPPQIAARACIRVQR